MPSRAEWPAAYHTKMTELRQQFGNKCRQCEATNDLHFDHIDPTTKSDTITNIVKRGLTDRRNTDTVLAEELAKCQLLCLTCHNNKTNQENGRIAEHGTASMYAMRCRCDACRKAANRANQRRIKAKRERA